MRSAGVQAITLCEQHYAVHWQPETLTSLNTADRDLIKKPCSLYANHRGLVKDHTCSTSVVFLMKHSCYESYFLGDFFYVKIRFLLVSLITKTIGNISLNFTQDA